MKPEPMHSLPKTGARIEAVSVRRSFAETGDVLSKINLSIGSGDFVSLLGPSGCGKSTLLRLLAGLDLADEGEVRVSSVSNKGNPSKGFVFQEAHLLPWKNVLDNTLLPLQLKKVDSQLAKEKALAALRRVGLDQALHLYPSQLSGGMKMRVSVARALVTEPELLLLDEPFAALDEVTRFQLQEDLRRLWQESGMTVVFVTHSIAEAVFLSNRVLIFASKPARIGSDLNIDLPTERRGDLRFGTAYLNQVAKVGEIFASQIQGARS